MVSLLPSLKLELMEIKPMKPEIESAIKHLIGLTAHAVKSEDALKFTQAALNLAHVHAIYCANK